MVVAYLRVSTARQHIDNQKGEISGYAQRNGIEIDRWITDTVSGKVDKKDRNLGKVLKVLKDGDRLIVTEISRLSRSLHEIMIIMKHCIDNNISIHSTKDGYTFDDSINSKVLSFAFGLAAEIEHKLISQRTKEAMALRKTEGKHMGRKKGSGEKICILQNNQEEVIVLLNKQLSISSICKKYGVSYKTFCRFRDQDEAVREITQKRRMER